jgi:SAM-dependent methyltransferase
MYYQDKIDSLRDLFGTQDIMVDEKTLRVGTKTYPIVNDVILLSAADAPADPGAFAEDIQFTFGEEWKTYNAMLPEHQKEFREYFDLVDLKTLSASRVCDVGCGMGRWSYFAKDHCREIILVDFSDAIFMARKNLAQASNALFFKGDLKQLPFREGFADFLFCLGVLHHLPTPCLEEVRRLKRAAPRLLIFLYYALDNRPWYFRALLQGVTAARLVLSRIRAPLFRKLFSWAGTWLIYLPLILLGRVAQIFGAGRHVPLYEYYHDKSLQRIEQDVYDRFFTRIEQRVTRRQILELRDTFSRVTVSDRFPYWHFTCER